MWGTRRVVVQERNWMWYPRLILALFLCPSAPVQAEGELRTWTSSDGNYVVRAELLAVEEANIRLRKPDGTTISVPLAKLSAADRDYLRSWAAKKEPSDGAASGEKAARAVLEQLGLRVSSSGLVLLDESRFSRLLRDSLELQKSLLAAEAALTQQQAGQTSVEREMARLLAVNVNLNAQLANLRAGDATTNNRLVATINANQSQIQLLRQSLSQHAESIKAARAAANDAREAFIQAILNLRTLADSLAAQYAKLAESPEAKAAVEQWNAASGKSFEIGRSRTLERLLVRLQTLEKTVLTDTIPLRQVGGGSLIVSAVFDGKYTQEMVLDSGANLVTLPRDIAEKCGVLVRADDPEIAMRLADGSRIRGHLVKIKSLRVGKFSAEDVDCAVLGVDSAHAPVLLGMSFLEHFKFQVDAARGTLTMVHVRTDASD